MKKYKINKKKFCSNFTADDFTEDDFTEDDFTADDFTENNNDINILNIEEIWKEIPFYPNYEASNKGQIRNKTTLKILKQSKRGEYLACPLFCNKIEKTESVHRIIALTFLEKPKDKNYVNHIDGNKTNNVLINLEWVSLSDNMIHARKNGLLKSYTRAVIQKDLKGNIIKQYSSIKEAEKETGVYNSRISEICKGKKKSYNGFVFEYVTKDPEIKEVKGKECKFNKNYIITKTGKVYSKSGKKFLKPILNCGYYKVTLYKKTKKKDFFVHRLVAMAYLPNPNNLPSVNHIDMNKINNNVKNLEWCSQNQNMKHYNDNC